MKMIPILLLFIFIAAPISAEEDDPFLPPASEEPAVSSTSSPKSTSNSPEKRMVTKYQRRSYFDFEDTLIRGKVMRPAGSYIYSRQHASFVAKIKMKRSFMPELKSTGSGE